MERTSRRTLLIAVLIGVTFIHGEKVCSGIDADRTSGIDADRGRARIAIVGQEHAILRHYLNRAGNRLNQPLDNTIKSVLLRNGPEPYGRGCDGSTGRWDGAPSGKGSSDVRLIFSEGHKEDGSIQALLVYGCSAERKDSEGRESDERLAGLFLDRDGSRITAVPIDAGGGHAARLRIQLDRELKIGGKSIIGLLVASSGGEQAPASSGGEQAQASQAVREEKIEFFLMDEQGVKPAGSVLKRRDNLPGGSLEVARTYEAALVLKKDMKGNITGILSPYVIKDNGKASMKGMFRFNWDPVRGEFVQE